MEGKYQKDKEVIERLVAILRDSPYSKHLRSMGQAGHLKDYRPTLNLDQRLDQRTYNVPMASEVAAVWIRVVNSLVNFRIVLSYMGKIGVGMASDHIMDAMMLFHTHSSSLALSLDGIWISQRKVLPWRMSTWLVSCVRLVVV